VSGRKFHILRSSWWAILFCASCTLLYSTFAMKKKAQLQELSFRYAEMEKLKWIAAQEQSELTLCLTSQTDPSWIELILMKDLGVVPEGWTKIQFTK
jgi:hypothetical protein